MFNSEHHEDTDLTLEEATSNPKVDMTLTEDLTSGTTQRSSSPAVIPNDFHPLSPNIVVEEERGAAHTIEADTTSTSSLWRHNVVLLVHIFFHATLIGCVAGAVVVSINRVYLYDHVVKHNATITYTSFFDSERIERYSTIIPIQISLEIMVYGSCQEGLTMYDSKYVYYLRACCVSFFVIITVSVFVQTWYIPEDRTAPVLVVVEFVCYFIILCFAAKRNGGDRDCIMRIVWAGICEIAGAAYVVIVMGNSEVSSSSVFPWISPFVVPAATFLFRYAGQRSELPVPFVTKGSCMISVLSSVVSRMAQCAYLT
eukprot:PhF_6_TR44257/c2_g2_i6/m.68126